MSEKLIIQTETALRKRSIPHKNTWRKAKKADEEPEEATKQKASKKRHMGEELMDRSSFKKHCNFWDGRENRKRSKRTPEVAMRAE